MKKLNPTKGARGRATSVPSHNYKLFTFAHTKLCRAILKTPVVYVSILRPQQAHRRDVPIRSHRKTHARTRHLTGLQECKNVDPPPHPTFLSGPLLPTGKTVSPLPRFPPPPRQTRARPLTTITTPLPTTTTPPPTSALARSLIASPKPHHTPTYVPTTPPLPRAGPLPVSLSPLSLSPWPPAKSSRRRSRQPLGRPTRPWLF